jgi:hypothetical protein
VGAGEREARVPRVEQPPERPSEYATPAIIEAWFFNRTDIIAVQEKDGSYRPLKLHQLTLKGQLDAHIEGKQTVGAYTTAPDGTCKWACFDIDTLDEQVLLAVTGALGAVPFLVEHTGGRDRRP